jgi:hypothetical protein
LLLVAAAVLVWFAVHRHGDLPFVQATDYLTWPSREWLSRVWLNKAQYKLGMERSTAVHLIGLVTVLVAAGLAFARGAIRSRLAAGVAAFALVWSFAGSGWAMQKLSNGLRPQASFAGVSFIDKLAHGEPVPALGSTSETNSAIPTLWSEVQFFNRSVQHTISLEADVYDLCCIPLGQDQVVGIEHSTGAASSAAPLPKWVATVPEWMPAGLATDLVFSSSAYSPAVRLERLRTPARAAWLSTGFDPYGWVRPRRPAQLRVFPAGAPGTPACMRMTITAPMKVRGDSASWVVRELGANRVKTGTIPAGRSERVDIPLAGTDPLELAVDGAAAGPDPVTGQPGILGLSDLRLVKCGAAEPQPKPEP